VLIVVEALHDGAEPDVRALLATLEGELRTAWGVETRSAILTCDAPVFEC
jgi:hypothetical protein